MCLILVRVGKIFLSPENSVAALNAYKLDGVYSKCLDGRSGNKVHDKEKHLFTMSLSR